MIVLYDAYKAALHHPVKRPSHIKFKKPSPLCRPLTGNRNSHEHRPRRARPPALPLSAAKPRANIGQYNGEEKKAPDLRSIERLAPLTKNRLNFEKVRRNGSKMRLSHQKPAAPAQHPNPHPTRDHANTPRQQQKLLTRHYPPPGAAKSLASP